MTGDEPTITINGVRLTTAQAMTIRVAIGAYQISLQDEDALGSDETGRSIRNGYMRNLIDLNMLMLTREAR